MIKSFYYGFVESVCYTVGVFYSTLSQMITDGKAPNNRIRKKGRETMMYKWRKKKNFSLADIAQHLGVTREAVRLWENGQSRTSMENIIILASILGVTSVDIEKHFAVESMHRRGIDQDSINKQLS